MFNVSHLFFGIPYIEQCLADSAIMELSLPPEPGREECVLDGLPRPLGAVFETGLPSSPMESSKPFSSSGLIMISDVSGVTNLYFKASDKALSLKESFSADVIAIFCLSRRLLIVAYAHSR